MIISIESNDTIYWDFPDSEIEKLDGTPEELAGIVRRIGERARISNESEIDLLLIDDDTAYTDGDLMDLERDLQEFVEFVEFRDKKVS